MPQHKLTPTEAEFLLETISSDTKTVNLRLREGEYQHDLARGIASFELELKFPDVKELTERLYGEKRADEIQFIRKIQTILKKMEKSNIVKILPKKEPWALQRYALTTFKFRDVDESFLRLATTQQREETQNLLSPILNSDYTPAARLSLTRIKLFISAFIIVASYVGVIWSLLQPLINPIIFIPAFYLAIIGSLILGRFLSHEK